METILKYLTYNPAEPLLFTSGLFLFLFLGFTFIYSFMRKTVTLRLIFVTLFSLYFYYKTSGMYFLLLIFTATFDFFIGRALGRSERRGTRQWLVGLSVLLNIGMLCYFKYTNFLIDIVNNFLHDPLAFENIFLPIGISFFVFQSMSYIIDIYRRKVEPLDNWLDYMFFVSFFPPLVAGPIIRARDFIPQIRRKPIVISREILGEAVFLIMAGLFKKAVISNYISMNFVDRIFDQPLLYSGFENLMGVYGYAMQIYCDFSGYSDMAIGIALLLGFRFNANFNSPYKSATITEFWRRWHISLSSWLKDYLYISLGGNRKGRVRQYLNLMITMLLGGLWHGASLRFLFWGWLHGVSLAIHKAVMDIFPSFKPEGSQMSRPRRILGIFITFNLVCLGWIFFRADSSEIAIEMLTQIFTNFNPQIWLEFIVGYKWVVILMGLGYAMHFTSERTERNVLAWFTRLPVVVYPVIMVTLIWIVMQMKSGGVQPFIYFQF